MFPLGGVAPDHDMPTIAPAPSLIGEMLMRHRLGFRPWSTQLFRNCDMVPRRPPRRDVTAPLVVGLDEEREVPPTTSGAA